MQKEDMAAMEAASKQSAKLPCAGSTPAVASEDTAVWVFNRTGEYQYFPAAVFSDRDLAESWILEARPIGVLTRYVLNKPDDPDFPEHYHYEEEADFTWLQNTRVSGEMEDAAASKVAAERREGSSPS